MKCFNYTCQGESHKATNKECQDYSEIYSDTNKGIYIAVVSDGHGGDKYFRSAVGAKIVVKTTISKVLSFINDWNYAPIKGQSLRQFGTTYKQENKVEIDNVFRQLFTSIYTQWRSKIEEDSKRPLTDWEKQNVDTKHTMLLQDEDKVVKAYGCTLMAYVQTTNYWFAFHIGDGKCVMIDSELNFSQPIPWDEKCFLNETTSICNTNSVEAFRYCYQADGHFPVAIFLGSDGLDDTFGDGDKLHNFYGNILKEIYDNDFDTIAQQIKDTLPELSKIGSKDDMSIAFVYDENRLSDVSKMVKDNLVASLNNSIDILTDEIDKWKSKIKSINQQLSNCNEKKSELETRKKSLEREYNRCINDLEKAKKSLEELNMQEKNASENDLDETQNKAETPSMVGEQKKPGLLKKIFGCFSKNQC